MTDSTKVDQNAPEGNINLKGYETAKLENIEQLQTEIRDDVKKLASKEDFNNLLQKVEQGQTEIRIPVNNLATKAEVERLVSDKISLLIKDLRVWILAGILSFVVAIMIAYFTGLYFSTQQSTSIREPSQISTEDSKPPSVADDESSTTGNNSSDLESHKDTESESNTN